MDKIEIKDEIIIAVKEAIRENTTLAAVDYELAEIDCNDVDHIAEAVAEMLYNAGYRKTFTSDFASDTQKAFKEGYQKGITDIDEWKRRAEVAEKALFDFYIKMLAIPSYMIAGQGVERLLQQAEREITERSKK